MLSFAALDVETANSARGSVCSFGLAIVRDGQVVAQHHFLTRPPEELDYFDGFNIAIHGIRPVDVADQPRFADRLAEVVGIVGELPVLAHNAAFDIGAIREGCNASNIAWPTLNYGCTLVMARRAKLDLISYRLPLLCDELGVEFTDHHRADADARAAAEVALKLAERLGASTLDDLATQLMVRLGRITESAWQGCIRNAMPTHGTPNLDADPNHPFYGRQVAFTGGLSVLRREAWAVIEALGATPKKAPTRETDFLVIGDGFIGATADEFHTGKAQRAAAINRKGGSIEVLTEADFWQTVEDRTTSGMREQLSA